MARKPRMGRNLDALLGTGGRERREPSAVERAGEPSADSPAEPTAESSTESSTEASREASAEPSAEPTAEPTAEPSAELSGERSAEPSAESSGERSVGPAVESSGERSGEPPTGPSAPEQGSSEASGNASGNASDGALQPGDTLRMLAVERIRRSTYQPRRIFGQDALRELADSLKAQGMIQPVIVRPFAGAFELIAGERRWRAAQLAGFAEIPAIVRDMEDRTVAAVSLIENIQREDLNPLEEAQALTRLCDEFGMTHAAVAESIGRSRAAVSNLMRLIELHDEVKVLVDKGELDMGHARALLRAPKSEQPALAQRVVKQALTVRAIERLIRVAADGGDGTAASGTPADPDVERLEEKLSGLLGAPVAIRHSAGGAGRLEIRYASLDELDGILAHIH